MYGGQSCVETPTHISTRKQTVTRIKNLGITLNVTTLLTSSKSLYSLTVQHRFLGNMSMKPGPMRNILYQNNTAFMFYKYTM